MSNIFDAVANAMSSLEGGKKNKATAQRSPLVTKLATMKRVFDSFPVNATLKQPQENFFSQRNIDKEDIQPADYDSGEDLFSRLDTAYVSTFTPDTEANVEDTDALDKLETAQIPAEDISSDYVKVKTPEVPTVQNKPTTVNIEPTIPIKEYPPVVEKPLERNTPEVPEVQAIDLLLSHFRCPAEKGFCDVKCPLTISTIQGLLTLKEYPSFVSDILNYIISPNDSSKQDFIDAVPLYAKWLADNNVESLFLGSYDNDVEKEFFPVVSSELVNFLTADVEEAIIEQSNDLASAKSLATKAANVPEYDDIPTEVKTLVISDSLRRRFNYLSKYHVADSVLDDITESADVLERLKSEIREEVLNEVNGKIGQDIEETAQNAAEDKVDELKEEAEASDSTDGMSYDDIISSDDSTDENSFDDIVSEDVSEDSSTEATSNESTEDTTSDISPEDAQKLGNVVATLMKNPEALNDLTKSDSRLMANLSQLSTNKVSDCDESGYVPVEQSEYVQSQAPLVAQSLVEGVAAISPTDVAAHDVVLCGNLILVNPNTAPKVLIPRAGYTAQQIVDLCKSSLDMRQILSTTTVEFAKLKKAALALNQLSVIEPLFYKRNPQSLGWWYDTKPKSLPEEAPLKGIIYPSYASVSGVSINLEGVTFKVVSQ